MSEGGDRVVLVTGAASGIGTATAHSFADAGWTVYATDVETPLPGRVRARCRTRELDVTSDTQCRAVVEAVREDAGGLDCLVNNAGYAVPGPLEDVAAEDARDAVDVLAHGPHRLARAALPALRDGGGRIVSVSSVLAHHSVPGLGAYCGGKAALSAMTDALRLELADTDVEVALVEPAWVETDFADSARERLPDDRTAGYEAVYDGLERGWVLECEPLAAAPEAVAATVREAATDDDPRARYAVGRFARFAQWAAWLPPLAADPVLRGVGRLSARLEAWRR